MNDQFKLKATIKSDIELRQIIDNREKYLPETVEASVEVLQSRGIEFSEDELRIIGEDMQARRNMAGNGSNNVGLFLTADNNNHIEDPDAPILYSKRAIYGFSIFFSALFGSVLLAMNVAKTKDAGKAVLVVLFGLAYTIVMSIIANQINTPSYSAVGFITGMIGGYLLNAVFWNRFIGDKTLYKPRPVVIPIIVGIVLVILFVVALLNYKD